MQVIDTSFLKEKMVKKPFNRLPKPEVIRILKENLKPVASYPYDRILDSCKYVRMARDYGYTNYKLCTNMDIRKLGLSDSFTLYQKQFFEDAGACVAIFNELNGKTISIVFRSVSAKDFMDFSLFYMPYGFDNMDPNFQFGDYVILVEGIYDADALRRVYPNVLSMLTSNITVMQSAILQTMTDNFIIAFDDDKAGQSGFTQAIRRLGTDIKRLNIFPGDKDPGVMEEKKVSDPAGFDARVKYYKDAIHECMTTEGFYL